MRRSSTPLIFSNSNSRSTISSGSNGNSNNTKEREQICLINSNFQSKYNVVGFVNEGTDRRHGVGYRSPCVSLQQYQGNTSPAVQGRSVREFEEQMANLRKENFNLKLRLYFIEESIPGYQQVNTPEGQETLMKQLIDAKVEMEILRKEVQEKQEILKEAAQAMNQMEKIQKDTENKYQEMIEELQQKIQYMEMEREVQKSPSNNELMNDLMGRLDISESVNTTQKIRELEGSLKQAEIKLADLQGQITTLDEILAKRDETIKEYEDKVKELAFQNAELLESIETKDKELASAEADNESLIAALRITQENFRKETSNMKICEKQMREQQDTLNKMQSTISIKSANTARLLERIQDYEKMVTKINIERNIFKRENRFFRAIINKLQSNQNEYYSFEKEEIYQKFGHLNCAPTSTSLEANNYCIKKEPSSHGDFQGEYKFKHKFRVNICNSGCFRTSSTSTAANETLPTDDSIFGPTCCSVRCDLAIDEGSGGQSLATSSELVGNYLQSCSGADSCDVVNYSLSETCCEPSEFPIRYTISDGIIETRNKARSDNNDCPQFFNSIYATSNNALVPKRDSSNQVFLKDNLPSAQKTTPQQKQNSSPHQQQPSGSYKAIDGSLREELKGRKAQLADKVCIIDELEDKLKNLEMMYHKARQTIEKLKHNLKQKIDETGHLMGKNNSTQNDSKNNSQDIGKDEKKTPTNECSSFHDSERYKELIADQYDAISRLRQDLQKTRAEAERSEKWRLECADVCSVLTKRLEELAGFLNSLLKHKDILDGLAADRRRAMRKAIDRSLDLSKSLNMTLSVSGISVNDQSLTQLSNLSGLLDEVECLQNLTSNSHETMQAQPMIETLKAENKALKKELDKRRHAEVRKERRSLPMALAENQSESETWSEPDRKVSMARIGIIEERINKEVSINKQRSVTDSEDENSHSGRLDSRIIKARNQERIQQLEQTLAQRDEQILEIQCQLFDADLRLKQESKRVQEITQKLTSDINELKQNYERSYEKVNKDYEEKLHEVEKEYNDLIEKRLDEQKKTYEETLHRDWISLKVYDELKRQLDRLKGECTEAQNTIDYLKENEQELKQSLVESEQSARNLQKKLDENTLHASKAIMDRTKALHDKLELEKRMQELSQLLDDHKIEQTNLLAQIANLEKENKANMSLKVRNHNDDGISSQSGYTSEELATQTAANCTDVKITFAAQQLLGAERLQNSSPDLGIESDAGRVSSGEVPCAQGSILKTPELDAGNSSKLINSEECHEKNKSNESGKGVKSPITTQASEVVNLPHDCAKVEQENAELRRKLIRTKRALEDTYEKLRSANQRKAQIEKDIKNQIVKTHIVLKNVRYNMENEL
uniref:Centrosomin N-terminal motif 1 domain-containing protein n=1 Tax=Glossina brevipalpis TaxID=37001 RepID=A0A1A9WV11_9MUSC